MRIPPEFLEKLKWYAKGRGTHLNVLMTSIVYKLLVVDNSARVSKIWVDEYGGALRSTRKQRLFYYVPDSAHAALQKRARALGCTVPDMIRPYMNDLYADNLGYLQLVDPLQFPSQPEGYWQPAPIPRAVRSKRRHFIKRTK